MAATHTMGFRHGGPMRDLLLSRFDAVGPGPLDLVEAAHAGDALVLNAVPADPVLSQNWAL
jgi:hypothetical protein